MLGRSSAAATLQRLVWLHAANAAELALHTAGAVAGLAALLRDKESAKAREHAAAALGNLCCRDEGIKAAVGSQAGVLTGLVQQLGDRHAPVRAAAAAALKSLAAHCVENQTRIGAIVGALKGLQVGGLRRSEPAAIFGCNSIGLALFAQAFTVKQCLSLCLVRGGGSCSIVACMLASALMCPGCAAPLCSAGAAG